MTPLLISFYDEDDKEHVTVWVEKETLELRKETDRVRSVVKRELVTGTKTTWWGHKYTTEKYIPKLVSVPEEDLYYFSAITMSGRRLESGPISKEDYEALEKAMKR